MVLLIENQYIPSVSLFSNLYKIKNIKFEAYENYQKSGFRNRTLILGANGIIPLIIPLEEGRTQRKIITEVRLSYATNWHGQHWKSIESSYKRSPWFEYYETELKAFYSEKTEFLFDWNLKLFIWFLNKLNMKDCTLSFTNGFIKSYESDDILDFRNKINPSFQTSMISKHYTQVFSDRFGFVPNLSILDLLMNEGKMASKYF